MRLRKSQYPETTRILSYLRVTHVRLESRIVMIRSELEPALNILSENAQKSTGDYNPGCARTKKDRSSTEKATKYHLGLCSHKN